MREQQNLKKICKGRREEEKKIGKEEQKIREKYKNLIDYNEKIEKEKYLNI